MAPDPEAEAPPAGLPGALLRFCEDDVGDGERLLREAGAGSVTTISPADVVRDLRGGGGRPRGYDQLAIVGAPPEDGIGYALAPFVAAAAAPRRVMVLDASRRRARTLPVARYVAETLPGAALQLAASGVAVGVQRSLAGRLLASGLPELPAPAAEPGRVLYLRPLVGIPAGVGGSITHSHGVIRAMSELGLDVTPLTTDPSIVRTAAEEADPPCRWQLVGIPRALRGLPASVGLGGDLALAVAGARGRTAAAADFVYQRHARFSVAGALLARLARRPLVLEYNGSEAVFEASYDRTPFASQLAACEEATLAAASLVVVTSEVDRRNLVERGIPDERLVVNPNGVDAERFARGGGAEVRRRLGIADDEVVLGFLGSFGPWHGTPTLADAFGELSARRPGARLLLVGDGPDRPEVARRLAASGAAERAILAGKIAPADVPAYLDACDVLVSPHVPMPNGVEFFGSPTKLFEYMAAGRAIAASRLGQIGDVLEHERTALLTAPGDVTELVGAIERLIDDREMRERLGEAARNEALEHHTWRANVQRLLDAYRTWALGQRP
jgi:glycosyltransferase involved in cell wall biosynthesis